MVQLTFPDPGSIYSAKYTSIYIFVESCANVSRLRSHYCIADDLQLHFELNFLRIEKNSDSQRTVSEIVSFPENYQPTPDRSEIVGHSYHQHSKLWSASYKARIVYYSLGRLKKSSEVSKI